MRLFLDAHVSSKRVGAGLRKLGHDVRAVDDEQALEGLSDADLFAIATEDDRVLVTSNVRDLVPLVVERASLGRDHAGVLLIPSGIRHQEFGVLISSVHAALVEFDREAWQNRVMWARRV